MDLLAPTLGLSSPAFESGHGGSKTVQDLMLLARSPRLAHRGCAVAAFLGCLPCLITGSGGDTSVRTCARGGGSLARLPPLKELGKRGQTGEDALRLRGGFGNQGGPDPAIGDFAGDISFESVDLERGVDPYEHDGHLPDSFPNNPESLEGRDESPPIVINADEAAIEAKKGTPGPDNLDAIDQDEVDSDELRRQTNGLMDLLSKSRPSGIRTRDQVDESNDSEVFNLRGAAYNLPDNCREEYGENLRGLDCAEVLREVLEHEEAEERRVLARKAERDARSAAAKAAEALQCGVPRWARPPLWEEMRQEQEQHDAPLLREQRELAAPTSGTRAPASHTAAQAELASDENEETLMVHSTAAEAMRAAVEAPAVSGAGVGQQPRGLEAALARPGANDEALQIGAKIKFVNAEGIVVYGVVREPPAAGFEGGRLPEKGGDCGEEYVYVECVAAESVMEFEWVPRSRLSRVQDGYIDAAPASDSCTELQGEPEETVYRGLGVPPGPVAAVTQSTRAGSDADADVQGAGQGAILRQRQAPNSLVGAKNKNEWQGEGRLGEAQTHAAGSAPEPAGIGKNAGAPTAAKGVNSHPLLTEDDDLQEEVCELAPQAFCVVFVFVCGRACVRALACVHFRECAWYHTYTQDLWDEMQRNPRKAVINPKLDKPEAEGGQGMFEEEGEVGLEGEGSPGEGREPDDSDVLQVVQDNVVLGEGAAEFLEGLGHGTGGHVADPELEGVGGQQVYPQTAY